MKYAAMGAFPRLFEWKVKEQARARIVCVADAHEVAEWVARRLRAIGYDVDEVVEVPASSVDIAVAVKDALKECDIIVVAGGVKPGAAPAFKGIADALGRKLVENREALRLVEEYYYIMHREGGRDASSFRMPDEARSLVMLPEGATVLPNPRGPAPGVIIEEEDKFLLCLPPSLIEAREIFEDEADPYVRSLLGVNLSATIHLMTKIWDRRLLYEVVEEVSRREPWIFIQLKHNVYSREGWGLTITVFAKSADELSDKLARAIKFVEGVLEERGIEYIKKEDSYV